MMLDKVELLNENTARLFAADCAERVVSICDNKKTPELAIQAARAFAKGKISEEMLYSAWEDVKDLAVVNKKHYLNASGRGYGKHDPKESDWAKTWDKQASAYWSAAWAAKLYDINGNKISMIFAAKSAAWCATQAITGDKARAQEENWQSGVLEEYIRGLK
jgi:hypothetical protein